MTELLRRRDDVLLKPLMIRGELIALTGDPRTACVLNQLVHWSQHVEDFDLFIEEEKSFSSKRHVFQHGWFYKPLSELREESMLRVTITTFQRYVRFLIDRKWVQTRPDSQNKCTGKRQYRLNLRKLSLDLEKKGYSFSGFETDGILSESEQESTSLKGRPL